MSSDLFNGVKLFVYLLDFNGNVHVQLKAKSFFGARHGLSTLQQLIWFDDEDNLLRIISTAQIIDEPKFRYTLTLHISILCLSQTRFLFCMFENDLQYFLLII